MDKTDKTDKTAENVNENVTEQPKVSVVIPVYNAERYLRTCLDSVVNQTLENIEIIIINDGSTDGSLRIIEDYAERDNRITVFDGPNVNVSHATNIGLDMASGEYVARVDADDYIKPTMYAEMYKTASENNLDVLKTDHINFTGEYDTFRQIYKDKLSGGMKTYYNEVLSDDINAPDEKTTYKYLYNAHNSIMWDGLYRRDFLNEYNIRWNEDVTSGADNGFFFQTVALAKRFMTVNKAYYFHRKDNNDSIVHDKNKIARNFFTEYRYIKNKLKNLGKFDNVREHYYKRKMGDYSSALRRIPFEMKMGFVLNMSEDFAEDCNSGDFTDNIDAKISRFVNLVVGDPYGFYFNYLDTNYKVSVIMPIYNASKFLRRTLDSVVNQTLKEIEIILVDDGSTDNSLEIMKEYQQADELDRITVISQANAGAGAARNAGLKVAHGKYLSILDADDVFNLNMLAVAYQKIRGKAQIIIFRSEEVDYMTGKSKPINYSIEEKQLPVAYEQVFSPNKLKGNPFKFVCGWTWDKLFERKFIIENNLKFQEIHRNNDSYFTYNALLSADRIMAIENVFIKRYVNHGSNLSLSYDKCWRDFIFNYSQIRKKLIETDRFERLKKYFQEKILVSLVWVLTDAIQTDEARSEFFDYLLKDGLADFEMKDKTIDYFAASYKNYFLTVERMLKYNPGEYAMFRDEKLLPADIKTVERDNGSVIFNFEDPKTGNISVPLFSVETGKKSWDACIAVIDVLFIANNRPAVSDVLYLGMVYEPKKEGGGCILNVYQTEFEVGEKIFTSKMGYIVSGDKLTVLLKYTGRVTGVNFKVRSINSRSKRQPKFSVINENNIISLTATYVINKEFIPITGSKEKNRLESLYKKIYGIPEKASNIKSEQVLENGNPTGIKITYNINGENKKIIVPTK